MTSLETVSIEIGAHEFKFVPPDQLQFVMRGVFEDEDVAVYFDFIQAHTPRGTGLLYAAYDLSATTRIAERARKRVTNIDKPYPFGGLAVIGASFSTRALAGMILRAGKIIKPKFFAFPHKFVASMDEANVWFDELRNRKSRV